MYAAFQAPHVDLEYVSSENVQECRPLIDDDSLNKYRFLYCVNIMAVDEVIGDIISSLKNNNLWDNTMIVFTTDNPGACNLGACNSPLRYLFGSVHV